ncbi:MAG: hypothetical protein QOC76_2380 [Mycobacterium sp.]|jgi:hypothetical protein|nr:hypothetical protein [Mycobacterium sp.]
MVTLIGEDRRMTEPMPTLPALLQRSVREFGGETYIVSPTDRLTYEGAENDRRISHAGC